jgi:hypothetical protein
VPLTSLFTYIGPDDGRFGAGLGESGEFAPRVSFSGSPGRLSIALHPFFPASGRKWAHATRLELLAGAVTHADRPGDNQLAVNYHKIQRS